jgi:hypothetical protein
MPSPYRPVCHCLAYTFPHRAGGGACHAQHNQRYHTVAWLCACCGEPIEGDRTLSECCNSTVLDNSAKSGEILRRRFASAPILTFKLNPLLASAPRK